MSTPPLESFLRCYRDHFEVADVRAAVIVTGVAAAHYIRRRNGLDEGGWCQPLRQIRADHGVLGS